MTLGAFLMAMEAIYVCVCCRQDLRRAEPCLPTASIADAHGWFCFETWKANTSNKALSGPK